MAATKNQGLCKIIIVGAGPSGLVLAILLGQRGVHVDLLDASDKVDERLRATHFSSAATRVLKRVGILDEIRDTGVITKRVVWRKPDGTLLAALDYDSLPEDHLERMVALPLPEVCTILLNRLPATPTVQLKWKHKVVDAGEDQGRPWVDVETADGTQRMEADYIIGCDGASSRIRQVFAGEGNYPGLTWEEQLVATNVYYDFHKFGWDDANFIVDTKQWYMASKIRSDGLWRVSYGEVAGLTLEQYRARQPEIFEKILPGNPKPHEYKLAEDVGPAKLHQRCADTMRYGRFILAGDSAHLCNPSGGLGLTGGLADVDSLFDCLIGIHEGRASDSILDKYDQVRREKWHKFINVWSTDNFRRLIYLDPDKALEKDKFLQNLVEHETDTDFNRNLQLAGNILLHDFTEDYNKSIEVA